MPEALSADLRTRVVDAYEAGEGTQAEIAARFAISRTSVRRWLKRKKRTASLAPSKGRRGPPPVVGSETEPAVRALVEEHPDHTLAQMCEQLRVQKQLKVSVSTLSRVLARMGITKKNASCHRT